MEVTPGAASSSEDGKSPLGVFGLLPRDVRRLLLTWLHAAALSRLACCSRAFRELADDEKVWERLFSARGTNEWERSQNTFKQSYIQRFGPLERPVVPRKRRLMDFLVSVNRTKEMLGAVSQQMRLFMFGLDSAGKSTILCEEAAVYV
jgi:hypothetical protein